MNPDAPWQGSQEAAPGKAVEAEHDRRRFAQLYSARRQDFDDRREGTRDTPSPVGREERQCERQNPGFSVRVHWRTALPVRTLARLLDCSLLSGPRSPSRGSFSCSSSRILATAAMT